MTVRSLRAFGPVSVPSIAPLTLYTVPAGRTLRLSSVKVVAIAGGVVYFGINGASWVAANVATNTSAEFLSGPAVLNPGDVLVVQALSALFSGYATGSGSLLLGAPS